MEFVLGDGRAHLLRSCSRRDEADGILRPWGRALARIMNRPLLDELDGVAVLRHPHELGLPLRELRRRAREGAERAVVARSLPHELPAPRPGLRCSFAEGGVLLEVRPVPLDPLAALLRFLGVFILFFVGLAVVAAKLSGAPLTDGQLHFGLFLSLLLAGASSLAMEATADRGGERILLTPTDLVLRRGLTGKSAEVTVPLGSVEALEIAVSAPDDSGQGEPRPCIVLLTAEGTHRLGAGLTPDERDWLKTVLEGLVDK